MLKNERFLLFTLAAINFTNIMDFMIMMPLGPQLMRLFQITPQQFGLLVSSYTFSAGTSGLLATFFIDRFDRKNALQFFFVGFVLGTFACGLAQGYEQLVAARIFTGMFGGILGASVMSIIADLIPMERRGTAMGVLTSGFSVASVFGVPFGLFIANLSDWHAPFLFLGLVGCVIFYFIWKFIPNVNEHILSKEARPEPWNIITNIITDKEQVKALLLMMALMLGHFCIVPFISPYMVANVGFTDGDLTYIYLIGGAFTIFTSPLIGKWSDKYGKLKMFTLFVVLCWIPAIGITHMPKFPLVAALFVTSLFFIFSGGRFIPAQAMVSGAVKPATRGSFMSFSSAMQQMMAGVASYVAGLIVTKAPDGTLNGYNYVGYISVALTMLCIFLARRLKIKEGSELTLRPETAVVES